MTVNGYVVEAHMSIVLVHFVGKLYAVFMHIYGSFALLLLVFMRFSAILYICTNDIVGKNNSRSNVAFKT